MSVFPIDAGMVERCESTEPSVMSAIQRWSAPEGWVGWEEEWRVGIIRRYYRSWMRFHLPSLAGTVRALLRIHLSSGLSNSGPLDVQVHVTEGDEWCKESRCLGTLVATDVFDPRWFQLELSSPELLVGSRSYLELRSAREETLGFSTYCVATFDLLTPASPTELVLVRA